jgi:stearoyl-CoA desaturase (delta-9 desaturase)
MDNNTQPKIDRYILSWMIMVHLLSIPAFFYFSWSALIAFAVMYFVTVCVGVTFGLHRLLSHRAFATSKAVERFTALCGLLSGQGPIDEWVAHHRMHHRYTETGRDPHNATRGFWYSHMFWLFYIVDEVDSPKKIARLTADINADPVLRFFSRPTAMIGSQVILGLIFFAIGGLPWLFWGVFLRLVVGYHATWCVNSVCHKWGYANFTTTDLTRNSWWVAILTFGEGWHNNHHRYPGAARSGLKSWEIDITYMLISGLARIGLVWDLHPVPDGAAGAMIGVHPVGQALLPRQR